uniref:Uncharacterized protein n=1 Tax=Eutreptiella gymnastica TaxID=73025 RepID=A0A7S4FXZ0_9EUGL|mmetsp:Transcript_34134/g.56054  ORF Transcript_34134/g.56054 Transcript_34134/m.56054 type:complete len:125 (+) Transcript_34134:207-581(+)
MSGLAQAVVNVPGHTCGCMQTRTQNGRDVGQAWGCAVLVFAAPKGTKTVVVTRGAPGPQGLQSIPRQFYKRATKGGLMIARPYSTSIAAWHPLEQRLCHEQHLSPGPWVLAPTARLDATGGAVC